MRRDVELAVKEHSYASVSEFFRDLLRNWKEEQSLRDVEISRKEFKASKGMVLKSLKDLR